MVDFAVFFSRDEIYRKINREANTFGVANFSLPDVFPPDG